MGRWQIQQVYWAGLLLQRGCLNPSECNSGVCFLTLTRKLSPPVEQTQLIGDPNKTQTAELLTYSGKMQLLYEMKLSNAAHRHSWSKILFIEIIPSLLELKKKNVKLLGHRKVRLRGVSCLIWISEYWGPENSTLCLSHSTLLECAKLMCWNVFLQCFVAMFLLIYIVPQSGYNRLARYPSYESLFAGSTNSLWELRLICKSNWGNVSLLSARSHLVFKYAFLDAIFLYARHTWISQLAHPHI